MIFYFDEHMPRAAANQLINRGLRVIMAADVGMLSKDDDVEQLPYATSLGAVLVTRDRAFAHRALQLTHAGFVCWTGQQQDVGGLVRALTMFASQYQYQETANCVFWLK